VKYFLIVITDTKEGIVQKVEDITIKAESRYLAWELANKRAFGGNEEICSRFVYIISV